MSPFQCSHSGPPARRRLSLMFRYEKNSSPPIDPNPLINRASASWPLMELIWPAFFSRSFGVRLSCSSSCARLYSETPAEAADTSTLVARPADVMEPRPPPDPTPAPTPPPVPPAAPPGTLADGGANVFAV